MNITDSSALRSCTSCQMCGAVCPKGSISFRLDKDGFYRPLVDESCIDCGLCVSVCYKFDKEILPTSEADLANAPLYAAAAKDDTLVAQTTSGGIADLIARHLIREGYRCVGVAYDDAADRAEHRIASTEEETRAFRGSKYIQSYTMGAFREMVKSVRTEKFAVFGTPCQIYAVSRYLSRRNLRDRCVLVDLYCHGCPSMWAWRKYAKELKAELGQPHFDRVEFRSKAKGWGNFHVRASVNGKSVFVSSPKRDEFYALFFSDQVLNCVCDDCALRSTLAYTDIRLGDFWGKKYAANVRGISAVSLATARGRQVFDALRPQLSVCSEHPYSDFLPYQSWGREYHPNKEVREAMLEALDDENRPVRDAVRILYRSQGLKAKAKRYAKQVAYYLPIDVVRWVKRFM